MENDEIINKITQEILNEMEESGISLTPEEISIRIDDKLDKYYEIQNKETIRQEEDNKKEEDKAYQALKEEFLDINNEENYEEEHEENNEENNEEKLESDISENNNDFNNTLNQLETEQKKGFFKEVAELYQEELQHSLDCFKRGIDCLKLMKKTSILEIAGIFLVLMIPAFFAGILTIFFLLFIVFIWQLDIILKILLKYLKKAEDYITEKINSIKKKIADLKSSGSFLNKLIFSNALYSIVMFNGILYLLLKGMTIPLKSAHDIEKAIANVIAKIGRGASNIFKAPSEMTLNAAGISALRSGQRIVKEKGKGSLTANRLKAPPTKQRALQAKQASQKKMDLKKSLDNQKLSKAQPHSKNTDKVKIKEDNIKSIKDNIANNIKQALDQKNLSKNNTQNKEQSVSNSEKTLTPKIGNQELANQIMNNVADKLRDRENGIKLRNISDINNQNNKLNKSDKEMQQNENMKNLSHSFDPQKDIKDDLKAKENKMQQDQNNLKNNIKKQGVDYDILSKNYDKYKEEYGAKAAMEMSLKDAGADKITPKLINDISKAFDLEDKIKDNKQLQDVVQQNPSINMEEYKKMELYMTKNDLEKEKEQLQDRHGAKEIKDIFNKTQKELEQQSNGKKVTQEQVLDKVMENATKNGNVSLAKDLGELKESAKTYKEVSKSYKKYQEQESTKHQNRLNESRNSSISRGGREY